MFTRFYRVRCSYRVVLILGLIVCCGGCGGNPDLATVSGVITLDGSPLADAFVTFTPESNGTTSFGKTSSDGTYVMLFSDSQKGAFIGSNRVSISTGDISADSSGGIKELVPQTYNDESNLVADVKSGSNTFDWELKSDAGKVVQPEVE